MKKNIVIVVSSMNMGGAQSVVSRLCNHWSEHGHVVTLIHTFSGEKTNHYRLHEDVILKYVNVAPFLSKYKIFNLVWKLINLRSLIESSNPTVVISFLTTVNIASILSTVGTRVPLVICERSWPPFRTLSQRFFWIYKVLFKAVNEIVVQTEDSEAWLIKNMPNCNVRVIPNPTVYPLPRNNEQLVHPSLKFSSNKKIILASGRLHKYKQFDMLIRAFHKLKDNCPDWDLVILGDGEEKESLNKLLSDLQINDRVTLPGSVGNMAEWYERSNIFVLSSILEGFPNVLLEAMTYGLPCVSFDCDTGPRDMIIDGVNGILVKPDHGDYGLTNAMNKLISDEKLRDKFARNSMLLREKYSVTNIMREWDNVLKL